MSSDDEGRTALALRSTRAVAGSESPLVARVRAFVHRITYEQQTKAMLAQNRLGEAIERNVRIKIGIELAQDALDNIDQLVKRERRKVDVDLLALDDAERAIIESAEVRKAQRAVERSELALKTLRLERQVRLESAEPQEDAGLSSVQRATAEIERINRDFDALIESFKARAADKPDVQEELQRLLEMADITRAEKIAAVMETM